MRILPCLALLVSPVASAERPIATEILDAVVVDVSDQGFDALGEALPALIPSEFDIPEVHLYDFDQSCFLGLCWNNYEYQFDLTNGVAVITPSYFDLSPGAGVINLDAALTVEVNSSANPMHVYAFAELLDLIPITADCNMWVEPFDVTLSAAIELELVNGVLEATVPPLDPDLSDLTSDDIQVSGCFIEDIEDVLGWFGLSIFDLVIDAVEPEIDAALADFPAEIETLLEDAFLSASIAEELDLNGVPLTVYMEPRDLQITTDGMRLSLAGAFDTTKNSCIESYGISGSVETPSTLPAIGAFPAGLPEHIGIYADDDFLNNAMFALWWGGLLCFEIDDDSELELPIAVDTTLLGLLAPGVYDELFPTIEPLSIVTRPKLPPVFEADGTDDLNLHVDQLGMEIYAELDGRQTRLVNLDLTVDAGVDIQFDGAVGELGIEVILDERITPAVTFNEYTADDNAVIEGSFLNLFDSVVGPILGDALGGLAFPLPAFEGIGLTDLAVAPAGSANDRVGLYAAIGSDVPYYDPLAPVDGCGCSGDATSEGCDTGCTTGALPSRGLLLVFPLMIAALRRRR